MNTIWRKTAAGTWSLLLACLGLAIAAVPAGAAQAQSASLLPVTPDDPRAVVVAGTGDGTTDDSAAIQAAIDESFARGGGGIVFLPSGRYRLTRTVFIWPGVRLFGTGATRPVFVLADNTPGFQRGLATMIMFSGSSPGGRGFPAAFPPPDSVPFNPNISDANPGTAFPALSNVDIEIGAGNAAAIGVRFHAAQHAYMSHMDFRIGEGLAGVYMVGNAMQDVRFFGGRWGILTEKPSPAWPFTLVDAVFDGQRDAAIREHEAGLTLDNVTFRNTPVGIEIDRGYGDWLYGRNLRFENISDAAVIVSNEENAYTQVTLEDVVAGNVPTFARFRDSGRTVPAPRGSAGMYRVEDFGYGLSLPGLGQMGEYATVFKAGAIGALPAVAPEVTRALPPQSQWVNVAGLGAVGDNATDNTAVLKAAIAAHRVLYFPAGFYRVSDTLLLKPDTVLIGLHPSLTQIILPDNTPGFAGIGAVKALVEAPRGGDNVLSGLGLYGSEANPRVAALLWRAGERSLVDDVMLQGGHGTYNFSGTRIANYNADRTGPPDPAHRWGSQYPSIWVDGGGGTFFNIWSANPFASSGLRITGSTTPGRVYQISAEHHVKTEIEIFDSANWALYAPQTEEEGGEGLETISLDIRRSRDILVANYHGYRVTRTKKPVHAAVRLENASGIRFRNVHVNSESGLGTRTAAGPTTFLRLSKFPYTNAIHDVTRGLEVREREFARLDIPGNPPPRRRGPEATLLADGFHSISGGVVDARGRLYFVDKYFQRIHRWSEDEGLTIVRDDVTDPVNLAIDDAGNLIVLSSLGAEGTVYSFNPDGPATELTVLRKQPMGAAPGADLLLPGNWWVNGEFRDQIDPETYEFRTLGELFTEYVAKPKAEGYVSLDGSVVLPAFPVFAQGADHRGLRFSDTMDAYSLVRVKPGGRSLLANNSENRTYTGVVHADGSVGDLEAFAGRGGESVARAADGRVFVANGQVMIYAADGRPAGQIDVPGRPLQLVFGGKDGATLYVLTHEALYAIKP